MIKVVTTLKKKSGMSTESFRAYYEDHHRLIGEKYLNEFATRYIRRYLNSYPDKEGKIQEPEYDVLLEVWFSDDTSLKLFYEKMNEPEVAKEIEIDEENLFDRSKKRSYIVEEHESQLAGSIK